MTRGLEVAGVYFLCLMASAICVLLLVRAYRLISAKLLLWTAISFGFLALNNLLLVCDMIFFRAIDLWPYRQAAMLAALGALLYGFIWEAD